MQDGGVEGLLSCGGVEVDLDGADVGSSVSSTIRRRPEALRRRRGRSPNPTPNSASTIYTSSTSKGRLYIGPTQDAYTGILANRWQHSEWARKAKCLTTFCRRQQYRMPICAVSISLASTHGEELKLINFEDTSHA